MERCLTARSHPRLRSGMLPRFQIVRRIDPNTAVNAAMQHLGAGENTEAKNGGGADTEDDSTVDINAIIERFKDNAKTRYKPSSLDNYAGYLIHLNKLENLQAYTRRQLAGPKGKKLLLDYFNKLNKPS